jgi:hypothetical protein
MIFYQIGVFGQTGATQILSNYSFEQKKSLTDYPTNCLSAETYSVDYFNRIQNWSSFYATDPPTCNEPGFATWYTHSPDWVGGLGAGCSKGWDGNFSIGISNYENCWQQFADQWSSEVLDDQKCYEIRIKARILYPEHYNKKLDVILSTEKLPYKENLMGKPVGFEDCEYCNLDYQTYSVTPTEDYKVIKRFEIDDLTDVGENPYNNYSNGWFEVHAKINMSDFNWGGIFPIEEYLYFTLDLRPEIIPGYCSSEYAMVDWVEFYESCPTHYLIYGAIIAGQQAEYVARDYIKAGFMDKGPAIVASNGKTAFKAKNYIELVPGFLSDHGSVLEIVPNTTCNGCSTIGPVDPKTISTVQQPEILTNQRVNNTRSFSETEVQLEDLKVFPNPTSGIATINYSKNMGSVEVFDNKNKSIKLIENINANRFDLDISDLKSGIYFVLIHTIENEIVYKKLVKI